MNKFFPALSLYEFLRIIIPGAYLLLIIFDISKVYSLELILFDSETYNITYSLISMFLLGLLVYSFDFPKMLKYFQSDLPST
jgi:phosphate starvation-inducible membrane PsiE